MAAGVPALEGAVAIADVLAKDKLRRFIGLMSEILASLFARLMMSRAPPPAAILMTVCFKPQGAGSGRGLLRTRIFE